MPSINTSTKAKVRTMFLSPAKPTNREIADTLKVTLEWVEIWTADIKHKR